MFRNGSKRRSFKGGRVGTMFRSRRAFASRSRRTGSRVGAFTQNPRTGGFLGIEIKFYDQKLINATLTAPSDATGGEHDPSATVLLNTVVQGDGESQRDGRRITMRSIFVEGTISMAETASLSSADAPTVLFVALVMDTQTNGATIVSEQVFTNPGASALTAAGPFRNLQFTKRYKVLGTRRFVMDNSTMTNDTGNTGGIVQSGQVKRFRFFKKLNTVVNFSGTTETVANIVDNSLHIIAYVSGTAQSPKLHYISRLRYVG